jgi:hypothetical protein
MLKVVLIILAVVPVSAPVRATEPLPASCDEIRQYVASYGRLAAIAWAYKNGFTLRQINQARKQCHI